MRFFARFSSDNILRGGRWSGHCPSTKCCGRWAILRMVICSILCCIVASVLPVMLLVPLNNFICLGCNVVCRVIDRFILQWRCLLEL